MPKYRKKPVIIEAIQVIDTNNLPSCVHPWPDENGCQPRDMSYGYIDTLEGKMHVMKDDWIIKGIAGEFYPCKPDIFEQTYEPIQE